MVNIQKFAELFAEFVYNMKLSKLLKCIEKYLNIHTYFVYYNYNSSKIFKKFNTHTRKTVVRKIII